MIPLADMRYDVQSSHGDSLARGDKVFVMGYVTQREHPMAIVMHPKKGWHMVELYSLTPQGFRAGMTP